MATPSPESVHADLMDCVQTNLAVLADHHYGPDAHLNLGAQLNFHWRHRPGDLPTVEPTLAEQIATAEDVLGLVARDRATVTGPELFEWSSGRDLVYVVADAYELPWAPYHGHQHMEHSFLLAPDCTVVDAYANETPWGTATPGKWKLSPEQLCLPKAEVFHFEPTFTGLPRLTPSINDVAVDGYLAAYERNPNRTRAVERLTLETWLLTRSRKLHAKFRRLNGRPADDLAGHLRAWDSLSEQTYLAYRRVLRGRDEPPWLVSRLGEMLAADRVVFAEPSTGQDVHSGPLIGEALRRAVAAIAGAVLGVTEAKLLNGLEFTALPRFSSFRLVEILERLEDELGVELDPADLVPENLHRVDDLCRIAKQTGVRA
ncbi:acyl carrier protein [Kibdelosporangium persicum]|uniref:Phosphopantetheine binding protein n=1 Tax=Kibdelosporangium persicum TaxID=2698649 RepID=A0ABX2F782_9PSEU|nr:acyl carrier protein [Kibdelosporangium persicum]NRN67211.1 Phosphopantetheine binding protein [Kibdelosporangium persicum]